MLLGFISLLLTVTQNAITKICVPQSWTHHMLPCSFEEKEHEESKLLSTKHFQTFFSSDVFGTARRLLAETNDHPSTEENHGYCASKVLKLNIL
jgi:mlo protein